MIPLYKNYKWRLVFIVTGLLFILLLFINSISYVFAKKVMEQQLGLRAQGAAVAVSLMIAEHLDDYRDFLVTRDVNSEYYRNMQEYFFKIKRASNIKFIYTINRLDKTHTEFILDGEPIGSKTYRAPGDPANENTVTLQLQAFSNKQPVILPPTDLGFGLVLSSSAPIIDEKGNVIGVVRVDIDSSTVFSVTKIWLIVLISISFLLLIFITYLLLKVSDSFLGSILKDKLTGAYSKRYSSTLLEKCMNKALRSKQDLFVMMLDLDHFKKINDTYGHHFGDIVLAKTSELILKCLRKEDYFIRYGGEEFLVLLFNLDSDNAMNVADRIRRWVESSEIYNKDLNRGIKITISIGVTSLQRRNLTGVELIKNADTALYKAKETRNAVVLF